MSFKKCSCGKSWESREEFLVDPQVDVAGYQVSFQNLKEGFFLFNHLLASCRSTMSIQAGQFFDLYKGEVFTARLEGTASCTGLCFHRDDLNPCPAQCECAFVRNILRTVSEWPKQLEA